MIKRFFYLFLFFIFLLFSFILTTPPTIYFGDSGEIVSAGFTLGIPHPPGYPLYMILLKLFISIFNLGDIGFRGNLFSVILSILSTFLFYYFLKIILTFLFKTKNSEILSISGVFLYILSKNFWFESINVKGGIYILTHVFIFLSLIFLLKYLITKNYKYFYLTFYLSGFLIPSHTSSGLYLVFILFILILIHFNLNNYKKILIAFLFFLLSFITSYFYLFIRIHSSPVVNWNDLSSFKDVLNHILRKTYMENPEKISVKFYPLFRHFLDYLIYFIKNYNILFLFFISGLIYFYKLNKKILSLLITFMIFNTLILIYIINTKAGLPVNSLSPISFYASKNFYLINDIIPVVIAIIGFTYFFEYIIKKYELNKYFVLLIIMFLPLILYSYNFSKNNHSKKFFGYLHPYHILSTLNSGDILFTKNDCPNFNILYIQYVKHKFTNIKVYDKDANLFDLSIYRNIRKNFTLKTIIAVEKEIINKNSDKVFYTEMVEFKNEKLRTQPYGIVYKLYPENVKTFNNSLKLMKLYYLKDFFENKNLDLYYKSIIANYFLQYALIYANLNEYDLSEKFIKKSLKLAGDDFNTLTKISFIYFYYYKDIKNTIFYLNKIINIDPYNYKAIKALIKIYEIVDIAKANQLKRILKERGYRN